MPRTTNDNHRYCLDYREKHKDAYNRMQREWRRNNPDKVKGYRKTYKGKKDAREVAVTGEMKYRCAAYPAKCDKQVGDKCPNLTRNCQHQRLNYWRRGEASRHDSQ
jgi:hypothetical protein